MSSNNFSKGRLMDLKRLIADITAVESPERAERAILGVILGVFWSVQAIFVVRKPLCGVGTPS